MCFVFTTRLQPCYRLKCARSNFSKLQSIAIGKENVFVLLNRLTFDTCYVDTWPPRERVSGGRQTILDFGLDFWTQIRTDHDSVRRVAAGRENGRWANDVRGRIGESVRGERGERRAAKAARLMYVVRC